MLGGILSNAADRWPELLGKSEFIRSHPYFLPSASAAFIAFLSFAISAVALKEVGRASLIGCAFPENDSHNYLDPSKKRSQGFMGPPDQEAQPALERRILYRSPSGDGPSHIWYRRILGDRPSYTQG